MLLTGYTPIFQVVKGGIDITGRLQDRLVEVKVNQTHFSEMNSVEMVFDDRDWAIQLPQVEDKISFLMGYKETGLSDFGEFQIDEVHLIGPPRSLKIVGHGVSMSSGLKVPKITNYLNLTIGDVVNQIASQAGLTASVDGDIAKIKLPSFNQNNQSGFHIIDQLARTYGGSVVYESGKVTIVKRGQASTVSGADAGDVVLNPEDFGQWDIWIQSRSTYSGVQAAWFDHDKVERKFETSQQTAAGLSNFPLIGSEFANPNKFFTLPGMFNTQEQAKAAADAKAQYLAQCRAWATITLAKGYPPLRVHNSLTISGMRDGIDGHYVVQTVTHSYKKSTGIVTELEAMSGSQV